MKIWNCLRAIKGPQLPDHLQIKYILARMQMERGPYTNVFQNLEYVNNTLEKILKENGNIYEIDKIDNTIKDRKKRLPDRFVRKLNYCSGNPSVNFPNVPPEIKKTVGCFPTYIQEVIGEIKARRNEVCHFHSKMEIAKAQMQVARLQQIVEIEFFSAKKKITCF